MEDKDNEDEEGITTIMMKWAINFVYLIRFPYLVWVRMRMHSHSSQYQEYVKQHERQNDLLSNNN